MIRDALLLDQLAAFPTEDFSGTVFRAVRQNLDPTVPSSSGGRWMIPQRFNVLYTSLQREGALAEISFHWSLLTPPPRKTVMLHTLQVETKRNLRLLRADLATLGLADIDWDQGEYRRAQEIGDAVHFLEFDGLIAPSARWPCDNLMLFPENFDENCLIKVRATEEIDWRSWGRLNGFPIAED